MNIQITSSHVARARDVAELTVEGIALLVEAQTATAVGIFPTNFATEPWRAHHLGGAFVDEISASVMILKFENSTASFRVKQLLQERAKEREKAEREKSKRGWRTAAAAE
jgi:hypothetical protein